MKEKIRRWYNMGLWTADMVAAAVRKGVLMEVDYAEIVGREDADA